MLFIFQKIIEKTIENAEIIIISALFLTFFWRFFFLRKIITSLLMLGLAIFSIGYLDGILQWIYGLGGDSFLESGDFNVQEAQTWLKTFLFSIQLMLRPWNNTAILLLIEVFILSIGAYFLSRRNKYLLLIFDVMIGAACIHLIYLGYSGFESGKNYVTNLKNQFDISPSGFKSSEKIDLFLYIGESTSTLNMSLYGYPYSTTPNLDKLFKSDEGFIKFNHVRSTHTHTSPSLLRALSIPSPRNESKIWGLASILEQAGTPSHLYSVQPFTGSFSTFSKFVFGIPNANVTSDIKYKGNLATPVFKDHELLKKALDNSGVIFFHSYAGHGNYLNLIDTSLSNPIDNESSHISPAGILGSGIPTYTQSKILRAIADYNQAITYIDLNVSNAIKNISSRSKPAVLIYFSDHGDSVYAGRGHESSNFIDEMSTVPMIIYFNKAYRDKNPKIFQGYKTAANKNQIKLLDQISPSILGILQISSSSPLPIPPLNSELHHPQPTIVERDTLTGKSQIDIYFNKQFGFSKSKFFGGAPEPTYISIINVSFGKSNPICYHRADSYGKALRAASVTNCIEVDLVIKDEEINIHHPPAISTGFNLEDVFKIGQFRKNKLWLDSKNINDPKACNTLADYLTNNHNRVGQILVEFPSESIKKIDELKACGNRFKKLGIKTSFYIPTHFAIPCAEDSKKNEGACNNLNQAVKKAVDSGMFSDLSFDFGAYLAIKNIPSSKNLTWNTWAVAPNKFHDFPRKEFNFIIMETHSDPNNY